MTSLSEYYEEKLYPLQDGVLNIISRSGTDFFLTGGTALSRGYYNHRYSDDLDFFLDRSQTYDEQLDKVLDMLKDGGFVWNMDESYRRVRDFTTLKVGYENSEVFLKLDFVNDLVVRFGDIRETDLFYRTDTVRNILSNKLSAVFRHAGKDVADIWVIAKHESINWAEIIGEAKQKDGGADASVVANIILGMPESEFESVAWINKPDWQDFCNDIRRISEDMLLAGVGASSTGDD